MENSFYSGFQKLINTLFFSHPITLNYKIYIFFLTKKILGQFLYSEQKTIGCGHTLTTMILLIKKKILQRDDWWLPLHSQERAFHTGKRWAKTLTVIWVLRKDCQGEYSQEIARKYELQNWHQGKSNALLT